MNRPTKERILAHTVVWRGKEYHLHIAELDTATGTVTLRPFNGETHSTTFINGTVILLPDTDIVNDFINRWRRGGREPRR